MWTIGSTDKNTILKIQRKLNEWAFGPLLVDGIFGEKTKEKVLEFQKYNNLLEDGIVGDKTYSILVFEESATPLETIYENNKDLSKDKVTYVSSGYSKEEIQLILDYEVGGGKSYYDKFLTKPTWPGYESGATIAIGVDLRFHSKNDLYSMFGALSKETLFRLEEFIGKSPQYAKSYVGKLKDIFIPYDIAYDVFMKHTFPKWENNARKAFPGFDSLPSCVRIALISLVFNRGSQINSSDRRIEMKNIRDICIPQKNYKCIADNFRSMTRLWKGSSIETGMKNRRYAEARMVEKALNK